MMTRGGNRRERGDPGFTLMEVLFAFGILSTALVAIIGLQVQSLDTMHRMTRQVTAQLYAEDAYVRYLLAARDYDIERVLPAYAEAYPEWRADVDREPLALEDLPFVPVLPVGWEVEWLNVSVKDSLDGPVLATLRPLWARSEDMVSADAVTGP